MSEIPPQVSAYMASLAKRKAAKMTKAQRLALSRKMNAARKAKRAGR